MEQSYTVDANDEDVAVLGHGSSAFPRAEIVVLAVVMLTVSVAAAIATPDFMRPLRDAPWWTPYVLVVGFAVSELTVFAFRLRREAIAFSMSEVPMVMAVVFVAPGPALAARLIGSVPVMLAQRRPPPYKVVFNLALLTLELAATSLFVRVLDSRWGSTDAAVVIGAFVATVTASIIASMLVSVAISRFEGDLWGRVLGELRVAWWLFFVNAALAVMVLALIVVSPWLVVLAVIPIGMLWYVMKAYGLIDQQLRDLDAVHGFTGRVGQSLDPREIGRAAVVEAAQALRTEGVALVFFGDDQTVTREVFGEVGVHLPSERDEPTWSEFFAADLPIVLKGRELDEIRLVGADIKEAMVAPVEAFLTLRDSSGLDSDRIRGSLAGCWW